MEPVRSFFEARGVAVIDVSELVRDLPLAERRVDTTDIHASELVHDRIGARLAEVIGPRLAGARGP